MNNLRWLNQSQPQTLYSACLLAYIRAVFVLLSLGNTVQIQLVFIDLLDPIGLARFGNNIAPLCLMAGLAVGGLGVANERKWGYWTLGGTAIVTVLSDFWWMWRIREVMEFGLLMDLMFDAALLILVFHPMSREYRKVWFR